jgi:protein SCO1/2
MKRLLILSIALTLFACNQTTKTPPPKSVAQESLPFFNQRDWTPEWIEKADSNFSKIHRLPAFAFTNQERKLFTEASFNGKIHVANFFFTKCRNICPKMNANMHALQEAFKNDDQIIFLSYSVTPEDDSVSVLAAYAKENKVDAHKWNLLTGDKNEIYQLAKKEYFAGDSGGYFQTGNEFLHTENFILVDQFRRIRGVYNGTLGVEIDRIKKDIELLKAESRS